PRKSDEATDVSDHAAPEGDEDAVVGVEASEDSAGDDEGDHADGIGKVVAGQQGVVQAVEAKQVTPDVVVAVAGVASGTWGGGVGGRGGGGGGVGGGGGGGGGGGWCGGRRGGGGGGGGGRGRRVWRRWMTRLQLRRWTRG